MPRRRLSIDTIERDLAGDLSNSETEAVIGEVHVTDAEQVILGDEKPRQTAHDQMQSRLFQLPAEFRWQIWEDMLGGYVFHILFVDAYRRMSHHVRSLISLAVKPYGEMSLTRLISDAKPPVRFVMVANVVKGLKFPEREIHGAMSACWLFLKPVDACKYRYHE